jgi:hypothetical protein
MWRSIFIAVGLMAVIVGLECMVIETAYLYSPSETETRSFMNPLSSAGINAREWRPEEWFPWAFMSGGVIVVLYAFSLPRHIHRLIDD